MENARIAAKLPALSAPTPERAVADAELTLERVSVRYPGAPTPALSGISLRIGAGEVAALLGSNGAGKSTLLRVAAGILPATDGTARVCGVEVSGANRQAMARLLAFVPQSEAVAWGFRVRDVVAMGRAPHQRRWMHESAGDRAAVDAAIDRCDLGKLVERPVETLSGGEQRRVAIARALAQQPRVLLLDEPAAFLDVRHRLSFYGLLAASAAHDRIACLVAMHDLDAAARFASSVILMREGRVLASGSPPEVLTSLGLAAALDAEVAVGLHAPSGERYFLPLKGV